MKVLKVKDHIEPTDWTCFPTLIRFCVVVCSTSSTIASATSIAL